MARIISLINFKGGVAKTTTTVGLAQILCFNRGKRVLVIDLDPQTNATLMLIGEERWKELHDKKWTLATLFKDALNDKEKKFDLDSTLQKEVSDIRRGSQYGTRYGALDLLPSSLDLISIQDRLANISSGKHYARTPVDVLRHAVKPIMDEYDYILIDCPPNIGIITLNGLRISEGFIIPTIPDFMSTYGIPQITSRVNAFSKAIKESIDPIGIVITKYVGRNSIHKNITKNLENKNDPPVFKTIFHQSKHITSAAEFMNYKQTLTEKFDNSQRDRTAFIDLGKELLEKMGDE